MNNEFKLSLYSDSPLSVILTKEGLGKRESEESFTSPALDQDSLTFGIVYDRSSRRNTLRSKNLMIYVMSADSLDCPAPYASMNITHPLRAYQ